MRAIFVEKPGDPSVLRLGEGRTPQAERGEIRIRVHGSGLNRADLL